MVVVNGALEGSFVDFIFWSPKTLVIPVAAQSRFCSNQNLIDSWALFDVPKTNVVDLLLQ